VGIYEACEDAGDGDGADDGGEAPGEEGEDGSRCYVRRGGGCCDGRVVRTGKRRCSGGQGREL